MAVECPRASEKAINSNCPGEGIWRIGGLRARLVLWDEPMAHYAAN
jgi:hypothetical protein